MHLRGLIVAAVATLAIAPASANADLVVRFLEGAPKDRFVVTNSSGCTYDRGTLIIDLGTSPMGLYFDTKRGGAGQNVAQPFEIAGLNKLEASAEPVADGAMTAKVLFSDFTPEASLEITVDVDDSVRSGPMGVQMIANNEMMGATVRAVFEDSTAREARFDADGEARVAAPTCA